MEYKFDRRWYGQGICYTWAFVKHAGDWLALGDPWPAARWPKKELEKCAKIAIQDVAIDNLHSTIEKRKQKLRAEEMEMSQPSVVLSSSHVALLESINDKPVAQSFLEGALMGVSAADVSETDLQNIVSKCKDAGFFC